MTRLDAKHVVVAGASRGIGGACAVACAEAGAEHVTLLGRSEERLAPTADAVNGAGAGASAIACDLTDTGEIEHTFAGIRVVSVAPTFVETEMTRGQLKDPEIGPALLAQIPQGRFGTLEEVAATVVFAASPAAGMVTGSSIVVDGGWTAR